MIPGYILASLWGAIGGFALLIGGFFGCKYNISERTIAITIAFSSGLLISAVSFEILYEAYTYGNLYIITLGFIIGIVGFTLIDVFISKLSIKKKSDINLDENKGNISEYAGGCDKRVFGEINSNNGINSVTNKYSDFNKYQVQGLITFAGALLDGIPEAIAIGLVFFIGGPLSIALVCVVFIANIFEGASASLYMRIGGWKYKNILGLWICVVVLTAISAMSSYIIFSQTDNYIISGALAVSAGSILAMISSTMLPQAFEENHEYNGFIMGIGFLVSFVLSHLSFH